MSYAKPDFTKRSVKIACWLNDVMFDRLMDYIGFVVIGVAFGFVFFIDWLLKLEESMESTLDELVYVPILVVGIFLGLFVMWLLMLIMHFLIMLFSKDYYNWYFKS